MKIRISKLRPILASLAKEKVEEYRELYETNNTEGIKPVQVIFEEGSYIILDGHHKSFGAHKAERTEIECKLYDRSEPRPLRALLSNAERKGIHSIADLEAHLIPYAQRENGF
jgi:hypothetical protein